MVSSLPAATKLGQGNVFTDICDSVHRGGLPQCMLGYHPPDQNPRDQPPRPGTPREQTPPQEQTPRDQAPGTPPDQAPLGADSRPPLGADNLPLGADPPRKQTLAYGQWAAGTHPTGMDSCLESKIRIKFWIWLSLENHCLKLESNWYDRFEFQTVSGCYYS